MKYFITIIAVLMLLLNVNSIARINIDSLKNDLYHYQKNDTVKVKKMIAIATELMFNKPYDAIKISDEAIELSKVLNYHRGIAESNIKKGYSYHTLREFDSADVYFQKALVISRKINNNILIVESMNGICWNFKLNVKQRLDIALQSIKLADSIGYEYGKIQPYITLFYIYFAMNNISKAQECIYKSLNLSENLEDEFGLYFNYSNLGILFDFQKNYLKSEEVTFKSLKLVENSNNIKGLVNAYNNLGELYKHWGKDEKSLKYYTKAIKIMEKSSYKGLLTLVYCNRSEIFKRLKRYNDALRDLQKAKKPLVTMTSDEVDFQKDYDFGEIYYLMGNYKLAITHLELARKNSIRLFRNHLNSQIYIIPILESLARCYEKTNNHKKSNEALWLATKYKDSLFEINKTKYSLELSEKYETEKKAKENKILKQKNTIQNLQVQRSNFVATLAGIGVCLLIGVALIILKERKKSEKLLLNILPQKIAKRLKKKGVSTIADSFSEASVIFIDIAGFTNLSSKLSPEIVVEMLNNIFTKFDKISAKYGIEKIKTIGDCYMAAAGIPEPKADHAEAVSKMAIEIMQVMNGYKTVDGEAIEFRIGLDCGPVVAGVIGEQKFIYDLWGDTVNTASRMESSGLSGKIQCSERFKDKLGIRNEELGIKMEERGEIEIKGKGKMRTYFLLSNNNH